MRIKLVFISLILLVFVGVAMADTVDGLLGEKVDTYLTALQDFGFSGSALVEYQGQVVLQKGYGLANEATGRPITPETVFDIGSITKFFTAVAVVQLESQGLLALDDSIAQYIPDLPEDKAAITVKHLLTHTSGLPGFENIVILDGEEPDFYGEVINNPLESEPGTQYQYSNAGYGLLAQIVTQVAGKPYRDYVRENIFVPAGMTASGFSNDVWKEEQVAHGYEGFEETGSPLTWPEDPDIFLGAGGILSTPGDLRQFAVTLREGRLLSEAGLETLVTPRMEIGPDVYEIFGGGLRILPDGNRRISTFGGSVPGHNVGLAIGLEEQLTLVVASGRIMDGRELATILLPIRDLVDGNDVTPVPQTVDLAPDQLDRLAGSYDVSDQGKITLVMEHGNLFLRADGQAVLNALTDLTPEEQARYDDLNARTRAFAEAMIDGNFEPTAAASDGAFSADDLAAFMGPQIEEWKQMFGAFQSIDVIGTVPSSAESATFIRFNFETGHQVLGFLWSPDDYIVGFEPGSAPGGNRLMKSQSETALVAFNLRTLEPLVIEIEWHNDTPTLILPDGTRATHIA